MTSADIRAFIDQHLQAWKRQDLAALVANYTDDCELVSPLFQTVHGRAQLETSWRELFLALSDWEFDVDDVIVDGGGAKAVLLFTGHATQRGEFLGVPATGRRSQNRCAFVYRFEGGRIKSENRLYDFTGMLVQLGVLKAKAV